MKRSARVTLRLVPLVSAAFLANCGTSEQRACVDQFKRVVDSTNCQNPNGSSGTWGTNGAYPYMYRWYWFRGPIMPGIGMYAPSDGEFTQPTFLSRVGRMATSTTRGGFGSTAGHGFSAAS